ncbi:coproporphyrinogen dehydrogenase HemZ [Clostridium sp. Marseille-P2415]|uniref:coproporphyrinogen dehydrogenase HemZ n=1 Tax=Clostridium sp. Marseille-P2415 TaxID=1805471 RepID=UPI000988527E|nr:coproporphyrinogen dehydrogenase HemZ [Clostridium sp. Marseille-P2415]
MIGIILEDQSFEQDIRELLMAFYPGESFAHEEAAGTEYHLLVRGRTGEGSFELTVQDLKNGITKSSVTEADFSDRFETKNRIKRMLYGMLSRLTGTELPWGTLTGIRPTKIAMTRLSEGDTAEEVRSYMKDTYLTGDGKIDLSLEIARREMDLLSSIDYEHGYSLYVGIPFCPTTCLYCSFPSFPIGQWEKRMEQYLKALFREMDYVAGKMKGRTLDTVYIGGGTPTSLSAPHLDRLICRLKATFDFTAIQEFTVEAGRPDSITEEKLQVLKRYGVTRISINPQTMKQETLDLIGRHHTVDMVKDRFYMARALDFDNINMDLIIGLPEEGMEDVTRTMEEIRALRPDGITVHSLAIKRAARLNMFKEKYGDLKITNTQEMIDLTADCARNMGQEPYYLYRQKNMAGNFENVGYSLPGKACIYNILIMEEKQTIVACGAGTTTKVVFPSENRLERVENVKDVEQYITRIDEMLERKEKMLAKLEM